MKDLLNIFREKESPKHPVMAKLKPDLDLTLDDYQVCMRLGEITDIPEIIELERKAYRGYLAWMAKDFTHDFKNNPYCLYLVIEDISGASPKMIGMINGRFRQKGAHISHVIVDPEYQRKGYGKILIGRFLNAAELLKVNQITLEVRESNVVAQQLYASFGFRRRNIKRFYYTDNHEDAIEMIYEKV